MLRLQSQDGRITLAGVRNVRQAILTGEQVQRADVLAIINELQRIVLGEAPEVRPGLMQGPNVRVSSDGSYVPDRHGDRS